MIVQGLTTAFKLDLLQQLAKDQFRIALYDSKASLSKDTLAYTTLGEVPETYVLDNGDSLVSGYRAGGQVLEGFSVRQEGDKVVLGWATPVWPRSTIIARGALIYNFSRNNYAVSVWDFGKDFISTNGSFTAEMPVGGMLRI